MADETDVFAAGGDVSRATGGEAVVLALEALSVTDVFGIVSVHNLPIYDAIERRGTIRAIRSRHEQGAVHAADGYARSTGRIGVAITSTGPGAANAVPGLFEAGFASSPVLMVTGQIDSPYYGKGKGFLHEAERQLAMLNSVTRRTESVRHTEEIPNALFSVVRDIRTGRPQPGVVEIPIDLQYKSAPFHLPPLLEPHGLDPDDELVDRIASILSSAKRPLLWVGGGVVSTRGSDALVALAEHLGAPVVTSPNGRGAMNELHPLCLGPTTSSEEVEAIIKEADVVLAVGTRFQGTATFQWDLAIPGRLIHIDADPSVIGRTYRPELYMVADGPASLEAILSLLQKSGDKQRGESAFSAHARQEATKAQEILRSEIGPDHAVIMDTIRELFGDDSPIVRDATVPAYRWGDRLIPIVRPNTSMKPTSAAIGPGLPLAIGAAVGSGRPTVLIQGDGGLMLSIGELSTAVQHELPIVVCVFNDHGYGVLRMIQDQTFGRQSGVDLSTPDFAALAVAMGARGERIVGVKEFRPALARAIAAQGPTVLDIDMGALAPMMPSSWGRRRET